MALPTRAEAQIGSRVEERSAEVSGPVDTPKQQAGSAKGLPPLVGTEQTQPAAAKGQGKSGGVQVSAPAGAVAEEQRSALARDVAAAATYDCSTIRQWQPDVIYSTGQWVQYQGFVYRRNQMYPGDYTTTPGGTYWDGVGACAAPTPTPTPTPQYPPTLTAAFPLNGMLINSRTPLFGGSAYSNMGSSSLTYSFKVCTNQALSTGCVSSGSLGSNIRTWRVPTGSALAWSTQYWWRVTVVEPSNGMSTYWDSSFTTGVRQPAVNSQFASSTGGLPFEPSTGNFTTTATDAVVATAGPSLSVVRSYNSLDPRRSGTFGAGWTSRWDMKIVADDWADTSDTTKPTRLTVTYPDGRQVRFAPNADGTFQPPPGTYATLTKIENPDLAGWRLTDKAGTSYFFDLSGRLTKIADLRGRTQTLTYNGDGKLSTATASGGRSLTFTWTGGHVTQVSTNEANGAPLTWTYTYEGDKLISVCAPVADTCTTYAYTSGSQYLSAVRNSDPIGYWRLGEASGTKAKDSGWGAGDASLTGVTLGQAGAVESSPDKAAKLSGAGTISLPDHAIAQLAGSASIETWFKTSAAGVIMAAGTDNGSDPARSLVYVGSDGKLRGQFRPTTGTSAIAPITSTAAVNDGQWHHVVLTLSGTTQQMFLDGQSVGTATGSGFGGWPVGAQMGNGKLEGGKWPGGPASTANLPLNGFLDEVALYDRPLSADDVAIHFAARGAAPHLMSKITLPSGRVGMEATYDPATDRVKTLTTAHGGAWQLGAPTVNASTGIATVTVTDPATNTLGFEFDSWRGDRLVSQTDQLGKKTAYAYDTGGFLSKVTDPNNNAVQRTYDKRGNVLTTTTCRSTTSNCQTSRSEYYLNTSDQLDPRNDRLVKSRDARSASATDNTYASTVEYTAFGEVLKETTPATADFPAGRSVGYAYTDGTEAAVGGGVTPAGLLKTKTDPRGNEWTYRYTAAGDLAEQTDPEGLVTKLAYDEIGRLAASTQVSDAHPNGVTTSFTYDKLGRILTQTSPGIKNEISDVTHTAKTTFTYDADGNKLTATLADTTGSDPDRVTTYTYDTSGRLDTVTGPEGGQVTQTYNTLGQVVTTKDARGTVLQYGYSKRGEKITTTLKGWTGSPVAPQAAQDVVVEALAYDPAGRLASRVDAMGRKTSLTYYTDNLPWQTIADDVKLNGSTTARDVVLEENTYDAAGHRTKQVTGGGRLTASAVYDAASRVTSQNIDPAGVNRTTTFTYDAADNVLKTALSAGGTTRVETREYAYTKTGQINRETVENGAEDIVTTRTFDDRGLPVSVTDPRGNVAGADAAAYTTTMRYDAAGRLVEVIAPQVAVEKEGATTLKRPSALMGFNTAGEQTHQTDAEGRTTTTTFNKAGQPTKITAPSYTPPDTTGRVGGEVGWWKADEGSGTVLNDSSGGNHPATLVGPTTRVDGRTGGAVAYTTGTHAMTSGPVIHTNRSYTVSAWVKLARDDHHAAVVGQDGTVNSAFKLVFSPNDKKWRMLTYSADVSGDPGVKIVSSNLAKLNQWTHLTGVYDAEQSKIRLYEDGVLAAEGAYTSTWDATGSFLIGRTKYDSGYQHSFQGAIDDVQAWDRVLTAAEIASVAGVSGSPTPDAPITPTVKNEYNSAGQVTKTTDPRGFVRSIEYDQLGRPVRVTDPAPQNEAPGRWVTEYDLLGEKLATVDPLGARTEATYDDLGRQITATVIERKPTTAAYTTKLEYYDSGQLSKSIAPGNRTTTFTVNAAGEITAVTDPENHTTTSTYDLAGRVVKATDPLGNATQTDYDLAGRAVAVRNLGSTGTILRTGTVDYDAAGNATSTTSGEGNTTRQSFDALGRVTSLIEPITDTKSITTTFGYDAASAPTRLTDARDNTTWTTYNSLGLPESVIEPSTTAHPDPSDRTWTTSYDAAANPVSILQPGGVRTTRVFDHLGRLTSEEGEGGGAVTASRAFGYDAVGRPTRLGDLSADYNDRGLLTRISHGTVQQSAFVYDELGRTIQREDASGSSIFTWDNASRLKTATDPVSGRTLTYGWDEANRLRTLASASDSQIFDYDAQDRLISHQVKSVGGTELAKITYGWDKDDNLTAKTTTGIAGAGANTYAYDKAGRLTSWTAPDGSATPYEWDDAGNRTKAGSSTFTYDARNRLTSGGGTDYTYTPRGTLASQMKDGQTTALAFDAFDRLIADGDSLYSYDALDRVTKRTRGTAQQVFSYLGVSNSLSALSSSEGPVAKYGRDAIGNIMSLQEGAASAVTTITDLHNDVVATFNTSGLTSSTMFSPFGEILQQTGVKASLGYQGSYTDPDTGKVNMHARWYAPELGAFTSRDSMSLDPSPSVQANRYAYANAGPMTGIDPTGHNRVAVGAGAVKPLGATGGHGSIDYSSAATGGGISAGCQYAMCIGGGGGWDRHPVGMAAHCPCESSGPYLSDEEAKRIDYMPNGRPAPKGYWDNPKAGKSYMAMYDPTAPDAALANLWKILTHKGSSNGKGVRSSAPPAEDRPNKGYKVWWNGKEITFPSKAAAKKYIQGMADSGKINTGGAGYWYWSLDAEEKLQKDICSKNPTWCQPADTTRWVQEASVRMALGAIGIHGVDTLLYNGDVGLGMQPKNARGGIYLIVDPDGEILKVGKAFTFSVRVNNYQTKGPYRDLNKPGGHRMMILWRTGDSNVDDGGEHIMYHALKNAAHLELPHNRNEPLSDPSKLKKGADVTEDYAHSRERALKAAYRFFMKYNYPIVGTGTPQLGIKMQIAGQTIYRR
ncbi:LamG-like jellyroll fold domain-containing protein [Nonomuraea sp. NPDC050310]|uniref:LamG-like jellyroll fold domain-containing protein n=1 Tax=Nonomuraea sp. NPDC050310 TaxID=3154935 RepID=UPI0033F2D584